MSCLAIGGAGPRVAAGVVVRQYEAARAQIQDSCDQRPERHLDLRRHADRKPLSADKAVRTIQEHAQQVWWTHGPFLLVMFFLLPVFILDTIKLSHRFAGPIYRLRNTVRSLANGEEFRPLKFREVDFWQGLAEDFNVMVARLKGEVVDPPAAQSAPPAEQPDAVAAH